MKIWKTAATPIDWSAEVMGRIGWLLILYCMIFGFANVVMRYVFGSPSLWIGPTLQMAVVLIACVGGVYALQNNMFVKLDLFYANFSPKKKASVDVLTSTFTFLFLGVLIWYGVEEALRAIKYSYTTPTAIPLPTSPVKIAIPIAGFFVLLVVLKQFVQDIRTILGK